MTWKCVFLATSARPLTYNKSRESGVEEIEETGDWELMNATGQENRSADRTLTSAR